MNELMNEGIEALQWTQANSEEFNDVLAHIISRLHLQHNLTIPDDKENLIMASWHVKKSFWGGGGGVGVEGDLDFLSV